MEFTEEINQEIDALIPILNKPSHDLHSLAVAKYRSLLKLSITSYSLNYSFRKLPEKKVEPSPPVIKLSSDKDAYFKIDKVKEREYKKKMQPYLRMITRPSPAYLK